MGSLVKKLKQNGIAFVPQTAADAVIVHESNGTNKILSDILAELKEIEATSGILFDKTESTAGYSGNIKLNVSLEVNNGKIQLKDKNTNGVVAEVDASAAFTKDAFLDEVRQYNNENQWWINKVNGEIDSIQPTLNVDQYTRYDAGSYLIFFWNANASKEVSVINLSNLIDIYTPGNGIGISETNQVSIKLDSSATENYLLLTESGLKTEGITTAISNAVSGMVTADEVKTLTWDVPNM